MLYYLVFLISGIFSSGAFANPADEHMTCTINGNNRINTFRFGKFSNAQEVWSDFGNTKEYRLDHNGHVDSARGGPYTARGNTVYNWEFFKKTNGTWIIYRASYGPLPADCKPT